MTRRGPVVAAIVFVATVALVSAGMLWRAAATAGGAVAPAAPEDPFCASAFRAASQQALGRRVLVLHADPGRARKAGILESGRAPEGWALYPPTADGGAFADVLAALADRAAAAFDPRTGFPADVEAALGLFGVKCVVVDDSGKRSTPPLRTIARAEPVLRLDGAAASPPADPVAFAAHVRVSASRETSGWTFADWEDELWGGAVTVETSSPATFVFPYPAGASDVRVDGAAAETLAVGPFLALALPAGRSRVEVRGAESSGSGALAIAGAAGLLVSLTALVIAVRPSRADVERAAGGGVA